MTDFNIWFKEVTKNNPYPFQEKLATGSELQMPRLIDIPTGCGKTAAVILAWLWRRRFHPDLKVRQSTPRRLIYCLPMRVLVEQTKDCSNEWLKNLGLDSSIPVYLLMGGEINNDWDNYPEKEMIVIGTQDQLISRALNRGYAMGRARWPMHFGLLNNDCLWVMDEVQLMGTGLATTAQLEAFRNGSDEAGLGTFRQCQSIWMSATMEPEWLETVDHPKPSELPLGLSKAEIEDVSSSIGRRFKACKILHKVNSLFDKTNDLAEEIISAHLPGTLTLVIANTVDRAQEIHGKIEKQLLIENKGQSIGIQPELLLLHSRFRPPDRQKKIDALVSTIPVAGRIVISTQVVEAGMDISAKNLFTDLAPWPSLVQRLGRLNREGKNEESFVFWIDLPNKKAAPYDESSIDDARKILTEYEGKSLGPVNLPEVKIDYEPVHVIRRKDLVELFDTTPDLAGNDLDVSRFIRDGDEHDVQIFWRDMGNEKPLPDISAPHRDELCPVSIFKFKKFIKNKKEKAYRWNFLDGSWEPAGNLVYPGQIYLLDSSVGGYTADKGWDPKSTVLVAELLVEDNRSQESNDTDFGTYAADWQTIAEHSQMVVNELEKLLKDIQLNKEIIDHLILAARWHDRGKAHSCFQTVLPTDVVHQPGIWAKAPGKSKKYERKHFRHELASALAMIQAGLSDISVYLAAAHHGKVRLSIRSFPGEKVPSDPNIRFARGVWDDDKLPEVNLGAEVKAPEITLLLEPMELGLSADGKPSWAERMLKLRNDNALGPFRLAFLETILRIADWRGSAKERIVEEVLEGSNVANS